MEQKYDFTMYVYSEFNTITYRHGPPSDNHTLSQSNILQNEYNAPFYFFYETNCGET